MEDLINFDMIFHRSVLVVDDEPVNRQMLGMILEQDYDIVYAENGKEALEKLSSHGDMISLVLLDLLMPEMDGYEVLQQIRQNAEWRKIPVIVLTSEKSSEIKSLQMGAADFLTKPYDLPDVIRARVKHAIKLFEDANIIQATETDSLTRLYTKEFFFEYAHQYDHRHENSSMDSIVINFNRFHLLNELHGRAFGDRVLCTIAEGLRKIAESSGGIACRYDADTFYLYIPHSGNQSTIIDSISENFNGVLKISEVRLRMGVYTSATSEYAVEQRFDRARQACNSLKHQYASSIAVYDTEMHEKEVFSAKLMEDFDTAIAEKQFKVNYQPKYNVRGERPVLCSAEALVSWMHPEYGRVRPDAFIPLFEENGFIQKLDRYVWTEAAEQMRKWKEEFGVTIPVSVNVSRVDIFAPDIVPFIEKIVSDNGLSPADYMLEVTESAYTDDSQRIIQVVNQLREKGFRVEMDDFGSGYSSLNMLTTLPIDVLKLDMVFTRGIARGNKEMRMVELVLDIARFLKVPVVAEGVETEEQLGLLKEAGCDIIQGWYFSKPVPPEQFNEFIKKEKEAQ